MVTCYWSGTYGGEFGGGLFGCALGRGEPTLDPLLRENINALLRTRPGYVWATSGTSHMGGVHGSLYRLGGGYSPEVVSTNSGFVDTGSSDPNGTRQGVPLPGLSAIIGLAEDVEGNPVVALPAYGVFAMDGTAFMPLYSGALQFTYPVEMRRAGRSLGRARLQQPREPHEARRRPRVRRHPIAGDLRTATRWAHLEVEADYVHDAGAPVSLIGTTGI